MAHDIEIDEVNNKFFTMVEGKECLLSFRILKEGVLDYHHTFVPPQLRNRGIASDLVKFALSYAREHNNKVIPSCPYVSAYIDEHPEWRDLLVD